MKSLIVLLILAAAGLLLLRTTTAHAGPVADAINQGLQQIEQVVPQTFRSIPSAVGTTFNVVLTLSGGIFMIIFLIGGVSYLVSAGSEEGVAKAKKTMINAVIGLVITLAAWAIGLFILQRVGLTGSAGSGGPNGDGENNQPFPVQFIVRKSQSMPVKDAIISIDGNIKGQTSDNGLALVIITNPRSQYHIQVTKQGCANSAQGNYTLDRGTLEKPSQLTITLNCP